MTTYTLDDLENSYNELKELTKPRNVIMSMTRLTPFYFRTRPMGGEDSRHILVWGRLQDAQIRQTTMLEHNTRTGAMKVPVVCDGALAWVHPERLTLLECGGAEPPAAWIKVYEERVRG